MDRHPNATLSPNELCSRRRIGNDPNRSIQNAHRHLLLSMKLLQLNADQLSLSSAGLRRLADDLPSPKNDSGRGNKLMLPHDPVSTAALGGMKLASSADGTDWGCSSAPP